MSCRPASRPVCRFGKTKAWKRRTSGSGWILSVALVITPKVPSEPRKSWLRSGPEACRGTASVLTIVPSGSTASNDMTMSSILPYLVESTPVPRWARKPAQRGAADRGRLVHCSHALPLQGPFEVLHDDSGLGGDRERRLVDVDDPLHLLRVEDDPAVDRQCAPCDPEPPPQVVNGIL